MKDNKLFPFTLFIFKIKKRYYYDENLYKPNMPLL